MIDKRVYSLRKYGSRRLKDDIHTVLITKIEESGIRRMMNNIDRVNVSALHHKDVLAETFQRNRDTVFRIKLIILHAMKWNRHIIDMNNAFRICDRTESETLFLHADHFILVISYFNNQVIHIRCLIGPRKNEFGIELRPHDLDTFFRNGVCEFFSLGKTVFRKIIKIILVTCFHQAAIDRNLYIVRKMIKKLNFNIKPGISSYVSIRQNLFFTAGELVIIIGTVKTGNQCSFRNYIPGQCIRQERRE